MDPATPDPETKSPSGGSSNKKTLVSNVHSLDIDELSTTGLNINGSRDLEGSGLLTGQYKGGHPNDEVIKIPIEKCGQTQCHSVKTESNKNAVSETGSQCQLSIAICGIALRLPAGVKTPQQLWEFLLDGGDARGRVPPTRYNIEAFHDAHGKPGTVITQYGYFLEEDISTLDTSFFSMPRMEVERTDPQQRLMLETARESLEDAGEVAWRGKRIGCYMGSLGEDWCEMFARETQNWGPYRYTGFGDFALSNRISYEMDFQGPRFVREFDFRESATKNLQSNYSDGMLRLTCCPP